MTPQPLSSSDNGLVPNKMLPVQFKEYIQKERVSLDV